MILTVTVNAALDVTYRVPGSLRPHATHRVSTVEQRAGGKSLNTARVLRQLGEPVTATGLLGGATGEQIRSRIPEGLTPAFMSIAGESRRAVVVADDIDATGLWEPGPQVTDQEWRDFIDVYSRLLDGCRVVVMSGSLPPGVPVDGYARLVRLAREAEVATIVDCDGAALEAALVERPDVVKPNRHELAQAVPDCDTSTIEGCFEAGEKLRGAGAGAVVASLGPDGIAAATPRGRYRATLDTRLTGNPTGAGDACVAALARAFTHRLDWSATLVSAVALSAAAVRAPVAGSIDSDDYQQFRHHVNIEER